MNPCNITTRRGKYQNAIPKLSFFHIGGPGTHFTFLGYEHFSKSVIEVAIFWLLPWVENFHLTLCHTIPICNDLV